MQYKKIPLNKLKTIDKQTAVTYNIRKSDERGFDMKNIKVIRKQLGLSQKELASLLGLKQSAISQYHARNVIDFHSAQAVYQYTNMLILYSEFQMKMILNKPYIHTTAEQF